MNIKILIPYFGKFPENYWLIFLKGCAVNTRLKVCIFTDALPENSQLPPNVQHISFSLEDFNRLASQKLGLTVGIRSGYKLCDFRPMYGQIFEDYLQDTDFWGHADLDLVFGDIFKFLTPEILENYEVISFRREWMSGSLGLYRNVLHINNLYTQSKDWAHICQTEKHYGFDECGRLEGGKSAYAHLRAEGTLSGVGLETQSITYVLEQTALNIRFFAQTLIKESIVEGSVLIYDKGHIRMHLSSENRHPVGLEFAYYHYISEKNNRFFSFPDWAQVPDIFYIDETGFYTETEFLSRDKIRQSRRLKGHLNYYFRTLPSKIWSKIKKKLLKS